MNNAVILAGGQSRRFDPGGIPKQFIHVNGKPLIMYSLLCFNSCPCISSISIVASEEWRGKIHEWLKEYNINKTVLYAKQGSSRQHSIYNGLSVLSDVSGLNDTVIIHDAARPGITVWDIENCVNASAGYEGATPVLKVTDTVYRSRGGVTIDELINRDEFYAGQTPEAYVFGKYFKSHEDYEENDLAQFNGSSEIAVKHGMNIHLFEGNRNNIKITTKDDIRLFEYLTRSGGKT